MRLTRINRVNRTSDECGELRYDRAPPKEQIEPVRPALEWAGATMFLKPGFPVRLERDVYQDIPDRVCKRVVEILKSVVWPLQKRTSVAKSKGKGTTIGLTKSKERGVYLQLRKQYKKSF